MRRALHWSETPGMGPVPKCSCGWEGWGPATALQAAFTWWLAHDCRLKGTRTRAYFSAEWVSVSDAERWEQAEDLHEGRLHLPPESIS